MSIVRRFMFLVVLVSTPFAGADEYDDFFEALKHRNWPSCLKFLAHINPSEAIEFNGDDEPDFVSSPIFVMLLNLQDDEPSDLAQRIRLLTAALPAVDQSAVVDSRSKETPFEMFVDEVSHMKVAEQDGHDLLELFILFLRHGADYAGLGQKIGSSQFLRTCFAEYKNRLSTPMSDASGSSESDASERRSQSPLRERGASHSRPRSSSQSPSMLPKFHITITPPQTQFSRGATTHRTPRTPGSAPSRMVPDAPQFAAPRTGTDQVLVLQNLVVQIQAFMTGVNERLLKVEARFAQEQNPKR